MKGFKLTHKKTGKDIKISANDGYLTAEYEGEPDEIVDRDIIERFKSIGYECNGSGWCMSSNIRDVGFTKMEKEE